MDVNINNGLFVDFLECKHRAYIKLTGGIGHNSKLGNFKRQLFLDYRALAFHHLREKYSPKDVAPPSTPVAVLLSKKYPLAMDVTVTQGDLTVKIDALMLTSTADSESPHPYIPVIVGHQEKVGRTQKLLLACWASVLAVHQRAEPPFGKTIHGRHFGTSKIKINPLISEADQII